MKMQHHYLAKDIDIRQEACSGLLNKTRKRFRRSFFLFLVAAAQMQFMSGCVFPPPYPSQLPALVPVDVNSGLYPPVTGYYSNKGKAISPLGIRKGDVYLTKFFGGGPVANKDKPRLSQDDIIMVTGPQKVQVPGSSAKDVFEIKFLRDGQEFHSRRWLKKTFFVDGYKVENGFIRVFTGSKGDLYSDDELGEMSVYHEGSMEDVPIVIGWSTNEYLGFRKAVDGSLIVRHKDLTGGLIIIFPFLYKSDIWYRFPPISEGVLKKLNLTSAENPPQISNSVIIKTYLGDVNLRKN